MKKIAYIGKGLQSLIPSKTKVPAEASVPRDSVYYIEVSKVQPNKNQPRKEFNEEGINELAQSIRKYGILQPLLVTKREIESGSGIEVQYTLIAGERRLRAAKKAGLYHVPVVVKDIVPLTERASLEMALIENIQREDLNILEEAEAFSRLKNDFGLTYEKIASHVGRSWQTVNNTIRLLDLPDYVKEALRANKLSMGHARALLSIKDEQKMKDAYAQVISYGSSVREVEKMARAAGAATKNRTGDSKSKHFAELEKTLGEKLQTHVTIHVDETDKGKIIARFVNHEQLNEIAKTILD